MEHILGSRHCGGLPAWGGGQNSQHYMYLWSFSSLRQNTQHLWFRRKGLFWVPVCRSFISVSFKAGPHGWRRRACGVVAGSRERGQGKKEGDQPFRPYLGRPTSSNQALPYKIIFSYLSTHQWTNPLLSVTPYDPITSPVPRLCAHEALGGHSRIHHKMPLPLSQKTHAHPFMEKTFSLSLRVTTDLTISAFLKSLSPKPESRFQSNWDLRQTPNWESS